MTISSFRTCSSAASARRWSPTTKLTKEGTGWGWRTVGVVKANDTLPAEAASKMEP